MTQPTRHRKRRTFTITDEAYEQLTAKAEAADTNRSRLIEELIDARMVVHLDDSDMTLLQQAAEAETLEPTTWIRKVAIEAATPPPDGQVIVQFDASDTTLLQEAADVDNLDLSAWVRKAALDAAAPPVLSWPTINEPAPREPLWWRMLPAFIRPQREPTGPPDHQRMIA